LNQAPKAIPGRKALGARLEAKIGRRTVPVIGITGTGGAGKSSLTDELILRMLHDLKTARVAVISSDPSRRKTGGALLGDRIRMNAINSDRVYMRSLATRRANRRSRISARGHRGGQSRRLRPGHRRNRRHRSGRLPCRLVDVSIYVMTSEFGAASQLEKIDMLDYADLVAVNKYEKRGGEDAVRDVRKQVQRNRNAWTRSSSRCRSSAPSPPSSTTTASRPCITACWMPSPRRPACASPPNCRARGPDLHLQDHHHPPRAHPLSGRNRRQRARLPQPHDRTRPRRCAGSGTWRKAAALGKALAGRSKSCCRAQGRGRAAPRPWHRKPAKASGQLGDHPRGLPRDELVYEVRGQEIRVPLYTESLSQQRSPRSACPPSTDPAKSTAGCGEENLPGYFPYTAGVFPLKRVGEDPTRMFAGEGDPARTNRRFKLLSADSEAKRLSTAFDSVTLYGYDPD
jgi:methylmalonyl-CoA mutase